MKGDASAPRRHGATCPCSPYAVAHELAVSQGVRIQARNALSAERQRAVRAS